MWEAQAQKIEPAFYYQQVESALDQADDFKNIINAGIKRVKGQLLKAQTSDERLLLYQMLYTSFYTNKSDSSLLYLNQMQCLAQKEGKKEWIQRALIEKSYIYAATGLLQQADSCLKAVADYLPMNHDVKLDYYTRTIYYQNHYDDYHGTHHQFEISQACDSILKIATPEDTHYALWASFCRNPEMPNQHALMDQLKQAIDAGDTNNLWTGQLAFALAYLYIRDNNLMAALPYLALSAEVNIRRMNRDIPALMILMRHAFLNNELGYANSFMKYIVINLKEFPERTRSLRFINYAQSIFDKMQEQGEAKHRHDIRLQWILLGLCSLLLLACVFIVVLFRKRNAQRHLLQESNVQLDATIAEMRVLQIQLEEKNEALVATNQQIATANEELAESNLIKEEYIGLLFSTCSQYIKEIENLYKDVNRKLLVKQYDELNKQCQKVQTIIHKEVQELYKQFDTIFLRIYPNFLEDFNSLLRPEEQIVLKNDELLTNELRIYALVRLGIESSATIAVFLHLSAQTVYNARLKMRGKAIDSEEKFSEKVKRLGLK